MLGCRHDGPVVKVSLSLSLPPGCWLPVDVVSAHVRHTQVIPHVTDIVQKRIESTWVVHAHSRALLNLVRDVCSPFLR
jgi:hypothetical protein